MMHAITLALAMMHAMMHARTNACARAHTHALTHVRHARTHARTHTCIPGLFRVNRSVEHTCDQDITSETVNPNSATKMTFPPYAYTPAALAPAISSLVDAGPLKPKTAAAALQPYVHEDMTPAFSSKVISAAKLLLGGEDMLLSCQEVPALCKLYEGVGHFCKYLTASSEVMKQIMIDLARAEHKRKNDGTKFDPATVDTSSVVDGAEYYRGFMFAPGPSIEMMSQNTLPHVCEADACHCDWGTLFRVYTYDSNRHPVLYAPTLCTVELRPC